MENRSFPQFGHLPIELRLMVWELATPTQPRALQVLYRIGPNRGDLGHIAYRDCNWDIGNPMMEHAVWSALIGEAYRIELSRYRTVNMVGDLFRAWAPEVTTVAPRPVLFNCERDMVYIAIKPSTVLEEDDDFRPLECLGRVEWAPMIQSLALLIGDDLGSYWGSDLTDLEIRTMVRRLPALRRFWLVLSLKECWPESFHHYVREDHGFMPLDDENHASEWPWFEGEHEAEYAPLLSRISAIAAAEGRADLEVRIVFDVNHDMNWWQTDETYRRYVNTW